MPAFAKPANAFHHGNLKAAAIGLGVEIVIDQGPHALKLDALSRRLGVTAAALYRHFASFDQLRADVAQEGRNRVGAVMNAALAALPPGDRSPAVALARFLALGEAVIDFADANPSLFAFMYGAFATPPSLPPTVDHRVQLPACLDDLERHGVLAADRRDAFTWVAWATVHGLGMLIAQRRTYDDPTRVVAARIAVRDNLLRSLDLAPDSPLVLEALAPLAD